MQSAAVLPVQYVLLTLAITLAYTHTSNAASQEHINHRNILHIMKTNAPLSFVGK